MRKKVFIYIHYLEIGGAERALISMLEALRSDTLDVDLFLGRHTGEFIKNIPKWVRILPEMKDYSSLERPIKDSIKEGHFSIALRRVLAKIQHAYYFKHLPIEERLTDESIYQYIYKAVTPVLSSLEIFGEYDVAISFLQPHNIVLKKVKAKKKICWVHTDYSSININVKLEHPIWSAFDHIVCVSDDVLRAFSSVFPTLSPKLSVVENILSPSFIRSKSLSSDVSNEICANENNITLLSVGRFSVAKRYEHVPQMCRLMLDMGLRFKWYIIGYGDDTLIRSNIEKYGVSNTLIILGKKENPYPYIAAADIYVQPSLYEGKSVAVKEAQILCRPVAICDYPTSRSQVTDGIDGVIMPMDIATCARQLFRFVKDKALQAQIIQHLKTHDYGNEKEIDKIYRLIE